MSRDSAAAQRQEQIRDYVLSVGTVRTEQLVSEFGVSLMTVHRDLDRLASQGWLRRIHGGATAERSVLFESNVKYRALENAAAKEQIGAAAVELVQPGQAVILDDSTSALAVAQLLLDRSGPVTIISNFHHVIDLVCGKPDINLIALGGQYHSSADAFFGDQTVAALGALYADVAFVSTSAITGDQCYHQLPDSIAIKRAVLHVADKSVLLADSSKFDKRALHRFAAVDDFDVVITDSAAPPELVAHLKELVPEVIVAPPSEQ